MAPRSVTGRLAFRALLTVTGVGPKLAIAILSALDAESLVRAIETGDKLAFKGRIGVGRKTVEHLLVDLKDGANLSYPPGLPCRAIACFILSRRSGGSRPRSPG